MKESIYLEIRNNIRLRQEIAAYLKVTEHTVYGHAFRRAPKLSEFVVIKIIMNHLNLREEDVLEKEQIDAIIKSKKNDL